MSRASFVCFYFVLFWCLFFSLLLRLILSFLRHFVSLFFVYYSCCWKPYTFTIVFICPWFYLFFCCCYFVAIIGLLSFSTSLFICVVWMSPSNVFMFLRLLPSRIPGLDRFFRGGRTDLGTCVYVPDIIMVYDCLTFLLLSLLSRYLGIRAFTEYDFCQSTAFSSMISCLSGLASPSSLFGKGSSFLLSYLLC